MYCSYRTLKTHQKFQSCQSLLKIFADKIYYISLLLQWYLQQVKYLREKKCNNIYSGAQLYLFLEIRSESLKRRKRCPWGICHSLCKIHLKLKTVAFECFIFSSIQYTYESSVDFSGVDQWIFSNIQILY